MIRTVHALALACLFSMAQIACAFGRDKGVALQEGGAPVVLPAAQLEGGVPLMQALAKRASSREFAETVLPDQVLSNLLWAAYGVNRPDSGKRTVPTAVDQQEIDLYVARPDGLFLYDGPSHSLLRVHNQDVRKDTGAQGFVKDAPIGLIYVLNNKRVKLMVKGSAQRLAAIAAGAIVQNVYLFGASEGLSVVVRDWFDKDDLAAAMQLNEDQEILICQTVGYPAP